MPSIRSFLAGLIAVVLLITSGHGASAQSPSALPGAETVVARTYLSDLGVLLSDEDGYANITLMYGLEFASPDQAAAVTAHLGDGVANELILTPRSVIAPNLGDTAARWTGIVETSDGDLDADVLIVQRDVHVWVITSSAVGTDLSPAVSESFAEFALFQNIPDTPLQTNSDGTSSGGMWETLPGVDDAPRVFGLVPAEDHQLLPAEQVAP